MRTLLRPVGIGLLGLTFGILGCSSDSPAEDTAASQVCDLYQDLIDGQYESLFDEAVIERSQNIGVVVDDEGISDEELNLAVQERCPGVVSDLYDLFGETYGG